MYQLPRHLLPPKLLEIAEYCGDQTAMDLLAHAGGGHISVPMPENLHALHQLVEWLGVERAQAFCQTFEGEIIQVPKASKALRSVRNAEIRRLRKEGEPLFNIARRFGLTERQIITICGEIEEDFGQVDMFGIDDEQPLN